MYIFNLSKFDTSEPTEKQYIEKYMYCRPKRTEDNSKSYFAMKKQSVPQERNVSEIKFECIIDSTAIRKTIAYNHSNKSDSCLYL